MFIINENIVSVENMNYDVMFSKAFALSLRGFAFFFAFVWHAAPPMTEKICQ